MQRLQPQKDTLRLRFVENPTSGKFGQKWGTQFHMF
jgi:hypothetical protein